LAEVKQILVLARRDHLEAMRVAAGFTIFGHQVRLVFMARPVTEEVAASEQAELLELSGIEPETTVSAMAGMLPLLDPAGLAEAMEVSNVVVNV
jgi:hypothetical protein